MAANRSIRATSSANRATTPSSASTTAMHRWSTVLMLVALLVGCGSGQVDPGRARDLPPCSPSVDAPQTPPTALPEDGAVCDSGGHTTESTKGPPKQPVDLGTPRSDLRSQPCPVGLDRRSPKARTCA